jgi:proline racemase
MISAMDVHACGEPGRVIVGRVPDSPGAMIYEKKVYMSRVRMRTADGSLRRRDRD